MRLGTEMRSPLALITNSMEKKGVLWDQTFRVLGGSRCFGGKCFQITSMLVGGRSTERARSSPSGTWPVPSATHLIVALLFACLAILSLRRFTRRSILHGLRINSYSYASYSLPTYVQPRFVGEQSRVERRSRSRDVKQLKRDPSLRHPETITRNNSSYISCSFRSALSTFTFLACAKHEAEDFSMSSKSDYISVCLVFCHVAPRL